MSAIQSPAKATTGSTVNTYSITSHGTGYSVGSGGGTTGIYTSPTFTTLNPSTVLTINGGGGGIPLLKIDSYGNVEWFGSPTKAADTFVKSLGLKLEKSSGFTNAVRRRYLYQSYKDILKKAEAMDRDELLDFLRQQVYNREAKVIMDSLSDSGSET